MPIYSYLFAYSFPIIALLSLSFGGWTLWILPMLAFVLIPILELRLQGDYVSRSTTAEQELPFDFEPLNLDWLLFALLPFQIAVIFFLGYQLEHNAWDIAEITGAIFSAGICLGVISINVAHELGHRNEQKYQRMAKGFLLTTLYLHFIIEHNFGHHRYVATPKDAASAPKGMNLYVFLCRSIWKSWISAWKIEEGRRQRKNLPWWHNQMWGFQSLQVGLLGIFAVLFSIKVMLCFVVASLVGILLLETINYVEHYGLQRNLRSNGAYEPVQPKHSWNAEHLMGRMLLFELTRHSDHHAHPKRKFQQLRYFEDAAQLPYGYAMMVLIAWCPPLWFAIMNPHHSSEMQRLIELEKKYA